MNSVSWFLYAANTLENIGILLIFAAAVSLLVVGATCFYCAVESEDRPAWIRPALFGAATCFLVSAVIPNKNTMWMIAASEMGERVAKTETATEISQEALTALRSWLREQTKK